MTLAWSPTGGSPAALATLAIGAEPGAAAIVQRPARGRRRAMSVVSGSVPCSVMASALSLMARPCGSVMTRSGAAPWPRTRIIAAGSPPASVTAVPPPDPAAFANAETCL